MGAGVVTASDARRKAETYRRPAGQLEDGNYRWDSERWLRQKAGQCKWYDGGSDFLFECQSLNPRDILLGMSEVEREGHKVRKCPSEEEAARGVGVVTASDGRRKAETYRRPAGQLEVKFALTGV
ncbi:hypothetical protein NPIL_542351 [Nephila pilipes]|uniref:Uncharacterized protein n=1 Tax=Nephila pilipes TaxID=299642 RepID=A0A8X6TYX6_NEPPI|nr:hypothetical protein NPIL_542351 [Nephila pilipes]